MTDDDLEGIAGNKDPLVAKLQERYGYGNEQAQREAEEFLRLHLEANGVASLRETEPVLVPGPSPPALGEGPSSEVPPSAVLLDPLPPLHHEHLLTDRREAASPPSVAYAHSATIWISPRVLRWITPLLVGTIFVLLFLPWTGAYPSGYGVYTQNAFQTIFGGVTVDRVGAKALDSETPYGDVEKSGLMFFYSLLVLLALVLVLSPPLLTPARVHFLPAIVQFLCRRRLDLLGAVALVAFLLLMIQLWTDFGLEAAAAAKVDKNLATERAAATTPAEQKIAAIHRGIRLSPFNFGRTLWLRLAVLSHVLLLVGLGLELWLKGRGTLPLPRITWQA